MRDSSLSRILAGLQLRNQRHLFKGVGIWGRALVLVRFAWMLSTRGPLVFEPPNSRNSHKLCGGNLRTTSPPPYTQILEPEHETLNPKAQPQSPKPSRRKPQDAFVQGQLPMESVIFVEEPQVTMMQYHMEQK